MLAKRVLCYHLKARGIQTEFLRFISETGSDRKKVLGVFCYVPRDLSNGTWIIAIGHHSRKLGCKLCLSVCLFFYYANVSNFAKGYRPQFPTCQAKFFFRQSPRSNLKSPLEIGGLGPPKGAFLPSSKRPR